MTIRYENKLPHMCLLIIVLLYENVQNQMSLSCYIVSQKYTGVINVASQVDNVFMTKYVVLPYLP